MTRYFYTDPLEAAYMAKHFGMRFVSWHSGKEYDIDVIESNCGSPIRSIREDQRYVVHPESLGLLKSREGDMLWDDGSGGDPDVVLPFDLADPVNHGPVILREDKHFFWPQVE